MLINSTGGKPAQLRISVYNPLNGSTINGGTVVYYLSDNVSVTATPGGTTAGRTLGPIRPGEYGEVLVYGNLNGAWYNYVDAGGGGGSTFLSATDTQTPGTIVDGDVWESSAITVTGAAVGDAVIAGISDTTAKLVITGRVTAADSVKVSIANLSGGPVTLGSIDLTVKVAQ